MTEEIFSGIHSLVSTRVDSTLTLPLVPTLFESSLFVFVRCSTRQLYGDHVACIVVFRALRWNVSIFAFNRRVQGLPPRVDRCASRIRSIYRFGTLLNMRGVRSPHCVCRRVLHHLEKTALKRSLFSELLLLYICSGLKDSRVISCHTSS